MDVGRVGAETRRDDQYKPMNLESNLATVEWNVDDSPHITVDTGVCADCPDKPCLHLCPTACYDHQPDQEGEIYFAYERCIECGACLVFCANDPDKGAVTWGKPAGGKGVEFDFG